MQPSSFRWSRSSAFVLCLGFFVAGCADDASDSGADDGQDSETSGEATGSESDTTGTTESSTGTTGGSSTSGETSAETSGEAGPPALPPLDAAPLTTEERIVPEKLQSSEPLADPRIPADLELLLEEGYGEVIVVAGEPILDATLDLAEPPQIGPKPQLLSRFMHLADTQLADDESPTRVASLDQPDALQSSFRPQETHMCQTLNAAVRTINAVHLEHALDFVLLGGDNIDSAQANELEWFTAILRGGGAVHCDSGDDDDPLPGADNDPKDPFTPVGLDVPWRWVSGNHDVLVQGNFSVASQASLAVGGQADGGTRDWSQLGGPVVIGPIIADPRRKLHSVASLLATVADEGDGHGIDDTVIARGRALYDFLIEGSPVRIVVVDSAAETGAASGVIHGADVEDYLRPTLDQAEADGEFVIVTSHHCSTSLSDGGGLGGETQEDAFTTADWQAFLGEEPAVIMHLCAHSHRNRIERIEPLGGTAYWEVATASLADQPQQMRLIEIRDEDNGYLSITGISVDYQTDDDPLAADGRARAVTDYTSAWRNSGAGEVEDRNVRLWVPLL